LIIIFELYGKRLFNMKHIYPMQAYHFDCAFRLWFGIFSSFAD